MAKRVTLYPDAELANADWTKQTWDIPAKNVRELRAFLKTQGTTVAQFKALPVYRQNVGRLPWLREL